MITAAEFHTHDIDYAGAFFRRFGEHSRAPLEKKPYSYSARTWSSDKVVIGAVECGIEEIVHAALPPSMALIHLPQDNENRYRVGRQSLTATADRAVLVPPDHEYTLRSMSGAKFGLAIAPGLLLAELEGLGPRRRGHSVLKPLEIRLTLPDRQNLFALHRTFRRMASAGSGPADGQSIRALESRIAAWCAQRILDNSGIQALSPRNRVRVAQIVDWIDRHLDEPISVERLTELSGIRSGGLNRIFKAARGMAPMELVRSRRLAAAQRMLRGADEDTLVARVAMDCGFTHLGRFAQVYREAFGETPSETLERARRDP